MTPFLAYVPLLFPQHVEVYVSLAEVIGSVGFMFGTSVSLYIFIGPLLGSLLYGLGGYTFPFLVFGSLSIVNSIILLVAVRLFLPKTD